MAILVLIWFYLFFDTVSYGSLWLAWDLLC